jgi:ABC-type lipoprotein export system ATPase subunit
MWHSRRGCVTTEAEICLDLSIMSQTATQVAGKNSKSEHPTILRAQAIKKAYATGQDVLLILKNVDLTLREGEFVAIEGKSGSGKSTLLHILGGLDAADSGQLEFDGERYAANPPGWLQPTPFRGVLAVPQRIRMFVSAGIILSVVAGMEFVRFFVLGNFPLVRLAIPVIVAAFIVLDFLTKSERWLLGLAVVWVLCGIGLLTQLMMGLFWLGPVLGIILLLVFAIYLVVCGYLSERPVCKLRTGSFGFVFQFYHLLPELSVLENTLMPSMVEYSWIRYMREKAALKLRATQILTDMGLAERLRHKPSQLSGGERQRVAIARALMNQPRILFADEPTGNLDVETGQQIMAVLEKLHRDRRQTIVMVTHDRSVAGQADRVLVLRNGRLERPGESPEPEPVIPLGYR